MPAESIRTEARRDADEGDERIRTADPIRRVVNPHDPALFVFLLAAGVFLLLALPPFVVWALFSLLILGVAVAGVAVVLLEDA